MSLISRVKQALTPVYSSRGGWFPLIREAFAGAWQRNIEWTTDSVAANHAVYTCITLISSDIGKLPVRVLRESTDEIWTSVKGNAVPSEVKAAMGVLRRPNSYQNRIQFIQSWVVSKLFRGNTYVLKVRGRDSRVIALHVLDPERVEVLVSPSGEVFYRLRGDNLSGLEEDSITVPSSEIIHDRMCCLFHPLVGVGPLFASGLAAHQGLQIQKDSAKFFANSANPGGILSAPGAISEDTAKSLKKYWEENFSGGKSGGIAVVGDGLEFKGMRMTAVDAQLLEQLQWTAKVVCSTFHVPAYKIGAGEIPSNNNVEALTVEYYQQCLQVLIEDLELCLDEGLSLPAHFRVELDLDALFRMDSLSLIKMLSEGVKGQLIKPNEGRKRMNLPPVEGGDEIYSQQQNYSLAALSRRDAREDPFAKSGSDNPTAPPPPPPKEEDEKELEAQGRVFAAMLEKEALLALST